MKNTSERGFVRSFIFSYVIYIIIFKYSSYSFLNNFVLINDITLKKDFDIILHLTFPERKGRESLVQIFLSF